MRFQNQRGPHVTATRQAPLRRLRGASRDCYTRPMDATAQTLHYYHGIERLRYLGSWMVTILATVLCSSAGIAVSVVDRKGDAAHACARVWGRSLLWISGIEIRVQGGEHLKPDRAYVFVVNHHSALDIPALFVAIPLRFRMLAKASLFRIPFLGWYMTRVGYVPVDRSTPRRALMSLKEAAHQLGGGTSVLLFPEGGRTPENQLGRFKTGGFHIAHATGLPLVPVALVNSGRLMARGARWPEPGVIEVRIGEPVLTATDASPRALADTLRQRIAALHRAGVDA